MKSLTDFQSRCAALLVDGDYHMSMNDYEMASKVYGDKFEDAGRGRAFLIGTTNRSMGARPDVFIAFISGSGSRRGPRNWAVTKEYKDQLKAESCDV